MKDDFASYRDRDLDLICGTSTKPARSRFRTDKSRTRRLIEEMFGPRPNTPKETPMNQEPPTNDTVTEAERLNRRRVAEAYRLSSDFRQVAKEMQDGDMEQLEYILTRLARRSMALLLATYDIADSQFQQASETLDNPHRMKGVQVP